MASSQPIDPGRVPYVPRRWTSEREQLHKTALALNGLIDGKGNFARTVTLETDALETEILDDRIRPTTVVALSPLTASAVAMILAGLTVTPSVGRATLFHAKSAIADLRFGVTLLG